MPSEGTAMPYLRRHIGTFRVSRQQLLKALFFVTLLALASGAALAQTGTLTDDAYTSPTSRVQSGNLAGSGPCYRRRL